MPLWQGFRGVDGNFGGSGLQPVNGGDLERGAVQCGNDPITGVDPDQPVADTTAEGLCPAGTGRSRATFFPLATVSDV